jgi:hypothetical protein
VPPDNWNATGNAFELHACGCVFADWRCGGDFDRDCNFFNVAWINPDIDHFADRDAIQLHRTAGLEAADRARELNVVAGELLVELEFGEPEHEPDDADEDDNHETSDEQVVGAGFHRYSVSFPASASKAARARGP